MAIASPPDDYHYIYQGVWTNWLRGGKVLGATLTVNPSMASVLSPALALIISIAGSQLWRLFQFALHQYRATYKEKNFLYHQQQITLRNTATDLNTLWRLIRLAFAWRRHSDIKVFWESFPLLLWTSFHLTLVILVGLFSSWLLQTNDQVLSRSPWCGYYPQPWINSLYSGDWSNITLLTEKFEYSAHRSSLVEVAQRTLDACTTSSENCALLPVPALPYGKNVAPGTCPFASSVCRPNGETIEFDTDYLSSATHFGLNAAGQDRISLRMQAKCAPLDDAKYVKGWRLVDATTDLPAHQVSDAYYGPGESPTRNATFSITKQTMECNQQAILQPYTLNSEWGPWGGSVASNVSTFDPIPELQSTDADTSLVMLMVNNLFHSPVLDPWFSAQLAVNDTNTFCLNQSDTLYTREIPLTTIGCTQQWQICNTDSPTRNNATKCMPFQGRDQLFHAFRNASELSVTYNPRQLATATQLIRSSNAASFYYLVYALGKNSGAPIKARNHIRSGTVGLALPDNQWQTEVEYWMQILLAYMQQYSINLSTGQFAYDTKYIQVPTHTTDAMSGFAHHWLCQNQVIHNSAFRNFNFFALLFCVTVCTIIIVLGLTIEDIMGYIRQHRSESISRHGKKDMWFINSDLEMLRTITELKGKLLWSRSPFGIPFAPVGAKATIDDLQSDDWRAKNSLENIDTLSVRHRTTTTSQSSPAKRRAHGYGAYQGNKPCLTCESFEMVSSGSNSSFARVPFADPVVHHEDQSQDLHYTNSILMQGTQSNTPNLQIYGQSTVSSADDLPRPSIQPLQQDRTIHRNGYGVIHPNTSIEPDTTDLTQPFHYIHDIPSTTATLADHINDQDYHMTSHNPDVQMFIYDDQGRENRSRLSLDTDTVSEQPRTDIMRAAHSRWSWLRRGDKSGTIC